MNKVTLRGGSDRRIGQKKKKKKIQSKREQNSPPQATGPNNK